MRISCLFRLDGAFRSTGGQWIADSSDVTGRPKWTAFSSTGGTVHCGFLRRKCDVELDLNNAYIDPPTAGYQAEFYPQSNDRDIARRFLRYVRIVHPRTHIYTDGSKQFSIAGSSIAQNQASVKLWYNRLVVLFLRKYPKYMRNVNINYKCGWQRSNSTTVRRLTRGCLYTFIGRNLRPTMTGVSITLT